MTDCEFCGLPSASLSVSASMTVCDDCIDLAALLDEALEEI